MVLELSKSIIHNSCKQQSEKYSDEELKNMMLKLMGESGIQQQQIHITDQGVVKVNENSNLKLHRFLLEAEKLGLTTKYVKKTFIEIC